MESKTATKNAVKKAGEGGGDQKELISFDNCFKGSEDTRLSNPPCNLRGTGWNRWEWL